MPLSFIGDLAVDLPIRFRQGQSINADQAWALNDIMSTRIRERLRWRLKQGKITRDEAQSVAERMAEDFTYDTNEPCDIDDPVMEEATTLARELIIASLARDGLAPPQNLDAHARTLAESSDALRMRARARIEARYNAAREAIANAEAQAANFNVSAA